VIELASRIPARLTPGQTFLVAVVAAGVLLALVARSVIEALLIGAISLFLRLIGHRPPRRSSFRTVLDEFESRLERPDDEKR
jgi:hypothetical protein